MGQLSNMLHESRVTGVCGFCSWSRRNCWGLHFEKKFDRVNLQANGQIGPRDEALSSPSALWTWHRRRVAEGCGNTNSDLEFQLAYPAKHGNNMLGRQQCLRRCTITQQNKINTYYIVYNIRTLKSCNSSSMAHIVQEK